MAARQKIVFLSHKCSEEMHSSLEALSRDLANNGCEAVIDPFKGGDQTARRTQEQIKRATHFVFFPPTTELTRWLTVEVEFARFCASQSAIRIIPIGATPRLSSTYIDLGLAPETPPAEVAAAIAKAVCAQVPDNELVTDYAVSENVKELGRQFERLSSRYGDPSLIHEAIKSYDSAIQLDLSNAAAWANKAWCLFKLFEDTRAFRHIGVAHAIAPHSSHVSDVKGRIDRGQRTIR